MNRRASLNKAKQHQSLRSLDSLAIALFVHGFAIVTQKSQQQVCRRWRRYAVASMPKNYQESVRLKLKYN